jgi:hypothetical protein
MVIYTNKKTIISLLIFSFLLNCKKEKVDNTQIFYNVDLTATYNNCINSYKIESNGKVTVLLNKVNENGILYESILSKDEIDSIQQKLIKIKHIKCDSTKNQYSDGTNYLMILNDNKNRKIFLTSNTCENYKELDHLIFSIIKKFDKGNKKEVFESLRRVTSIWSRYELH